MSCTLLLRASGLRLLTIQIYYLVNSIDYTFGHKKGSHEAFVLADSGQVRFDSFTQ